MGSHLTGSDRSDRILEIKTDDVQVVIRCPKRPNYFNDTDNQTKESTLHICGRNIINVKINDSDVFESDNNEQSSLKFDVSPLFFEQTDYMISVKAANQSKVELFHENYNIKSKIGKTFDEDNQKSGTINFENNIGYSDFEVYCNDSRVLEFRIEVFPTKISYKDDYLSMRNDIFDEVNNALLSFMQKTYHEFSVGSTNRSTTAMFFEIIKQIFLKFQNALNTVARMPHHELCIEHQIVPYHKVKKTDQTTIKWLTNHPSFLNRTPSGFKAVKAPNVKKQITYNTLENQFIKFMIQSTVKRLNNFSELYGNGREDDDIIKAVDDMVKKLNGYINYSFLRNVDEYNSASSMSLVFEMAPGYRETYKYYLILQRGLSIHGDVFKLSLKDTAQLYEYWCFIKLASLLKNNFGLISPDIIKVHNKGVTVDLVKGKSSEISFLNPRTNEKIYLTYNPGELETQTANQIPDYVLSLKKNRSAIQYKYIFDAKYRIESNPDKHYPDKKPGPKVDSINTMHRYRDSIVYENDSPSRFLFEKTMFGAYVLFPYSDPDGEYENHKFYKSIEKVNIGGIPFLPGKTEFVTKLLSELIEESPESAFERASVPLGIDERLAKVDWSVKDVMVGPVNDDMMYNIIKDEKSYFVPVKSVGDIFLIRYIALLTHKGIKHYGQVIATTIIKRSEIGFLKADAESYDEKYCKFTVEDWLSLEPEIIIRNDFPAKPEFTNKFLLDNCKDTHQLFSISSDNEYRIMSEINRAYDEYADNNQEDDIHSINDKYVITIHKGEFIIADMSGAIRKRLSVFEYAQHPRWIFNEIKEIVGD